MEKKQPLQNRAYSILQVREIDDAGEQRVIRGMATTPNVDRVGDIIDPMGIKYTNPMPFLWQHQHDKPIGSVKFGDPTENGIEFEAEILHPDSVKSEALRERLQEAWDSIRTGLVRAVSIGFRSIEHAYMESGGIHYLKSEVYELSGVTIPANSDALIADVKAFDAKIREEAGIVDEIPEDNPLAATGTKGRVVKLDDPARDRAEPFVIKHIRRTK